MCHIRPTNVLYPKSVTSFVSVLRVYFLLVDEYIYINFSNACVLHKAYSITDLCRESWALCLPESRPTDEPKKKATNVDMRYIQINLPTRGTERGPGSLAALWKALYIRGFTKKTPVS